MFSLPRIAVIIASALAALAILAQFLAYQPSTCSQGATPDRVTTKDIQHQLGPLLSQNSTIYCADDARFNDATERWQVYGKPHVNVVVEPGTEADIATIVKPVQYANSKSLDFLAVSRGHGSTATLRRFDGIQIYTHNLNKIELSSDMNSAHFQAGVYGDQVIRTLWEKGYVTNTGAAACVGLLGLGLGGGHGRWQGYHGLVIDSFIRLNVVLANGTEVVASETSNPDLFWAMKGAGHNFGIVTSFDAHIYPRISPTWYHKTYTFSQDKLEQVFHAVNKLSGNGTQPKEIGSFGAYAFNTSFSTTEPVIMWALDYIGSEADAEPFLKPFDEIGAVFSEAVTAPYTEIPKLSATDVNSKLCEKGLQRMQFSAGLQVYNVTAQRAIFDLFQRNVLAQPALIGLAVVLEGYPVQGVRRVDPSTIAFPMRDDFLLVTFIMTYEPNSSYNDFAITWGRETVRLWNEGQPTRKPTTYVNYAFGGEPLEEMYGYEPWRLQKLKALKRQYDPLEKFSYYNPIPLY